MKCADNECNLRGVRDAGQVDYSVLSAQHRLQVFHRARQLAEFPPTHGELIWVARDSPTSVLAGSPLRESPRFPQTPFASPRKS